MNLENEILELLDQREVKRLKANISILVKNINGSKGMDFQYNSDLKIVAASVIKIQIILAVLNEIYNDNLKLESKILVKKEDILKDTEIFVFGEKEYTVRELISWMIIISDNTATNVLINYLGFPKINDYITKTLSLENTVLQRLMLDKKAIKQGKNTYFSQDDMFLTLKKLFKKEILNEELCDFAIKTLHNQRCKKIMKYLYQDNEFANKTGTFPGIVHDVGVFTINKKEIYVGISIYDHKDRDQANKVIGIIGKGIYKLF